MTAPYVQGGPVLLSLEFDEEGHRTYKVRWLVVADPAVGPAGVSRATGLPQPGDYWNLVVNGITDYDVWAFCRADMSINRVLAEEPDAHWYVDQRFSTKPPDRNKTRCQDERIEDPVLEPPKVNGSTVKYVKEFTEDRFGLPILTSSFEVIRGPQVEFDRHRGTVTIEMNVAVLDLQFIDSLLNCVNDGPMWGFASRCVKFSKRDFERKFYGHCSVYYTLKLDFDTDDDGFDRDVLDEGTKVLSGRWASNGHWELVNIGGATPDHNNPQHFIRFTDRQGNPCKVILDGTGLPSDTADLGGTGTGLGGPAGSVHVEAYEEADLLSLGIPATF